MVRLRDQIIWGDAIRIRRELLENEGLDEVLLLNLGRR